MPDEFKAEADREKRFINTVKIVDGKITALFVSHDDDEWLEVDKIFDDFESFASYAETFLDVK